MPGRPGTTPRISLRPDHAWPRPARNGRATTKPSVSSSTSSAPHRTISPPIRELADIEQRRRDSRRHRTRHRQARARSGAGASARPRSIQWSPNSRPGWPSLSTNVPLGLPESDVLAARHARVRARARGERSRRADCHDAGQHPVSGQSCRDGRNARHHARRRFTSSSTSATRKSVRSRQDSRGRLPGLRICDVPDSYDEALVSAALASSARADRLRGRAPDRGSPWSG